MQAWEASAGVGPRELAVLAATALLAMTVAGLAQGSIEPSETSSGLLVGELKLADGDEGPSNRVTASFGADNLAPGQQTVDRLTFLREPPARPGPGGVEVRLSVDVHGPEGALADAVRVEQLTYGDETLRDRAAETCGRPLSLSALAACTGEREGPLHGLADPTPEGRDLVLGVRLPADTSNGLQGATTEFTVEARLEAWPISQAPTLSRSSGFSGSSGPPDPFDPSGSPGSSPSTLVPVEACEPLAVEMTPRKAPIPGQASVDLVHQPVAVEALLEADLAAGCGPA